MDSILNLNAIFAPISELRPSGEDLRYTQVYDQIKEARRAEEPLEQGEWQTDIKTADWKQVIQLCEDALTSKSKDLQIAVWLTEAMVRQHGYAGLAEGLQIILTLMQDFWPTLYPPIEDGDLDYRIGPFTYLDEKLPNVLYQAPLCETASAKAYNYFHWEESKLVGSSQNLDKEQKTRRQALINEGKVSAEEFAAAVNASSIDFYESLTHQLERCRTNLQVLDTVTGEKFAADPPGLTHLMAAIDACWYIVGRIHKDKQKSEISRQEDIETLQNPVEETGESWEEEPERTAGSLNPWAIHQPALSDISEPERSLWRQVAAELEKGKLKSALDLLLSAASLAPSVREKNRYLLLVSKLCLRADRVDLASPIVEELHKLIEAHKLEQWEHPAWIADVVETLYRCLACKGEGEGERARSLLEKLCLLNITKAAAYRIG